MDKVNLYNADGVVISTYSDVIGYTHEYVEHRENGYRSKVYCDTANGEYFAVAPADDDEATEADYQDALNELGVTFDEEI